MTQAFKPFELMTDEDYANIGLRCGLEVHQQLYTRRKLFCRCPAGRYSGEYDAEILRHMRPTLSELGEYDGTALMEKKTCKNIYYLIHHDTVCTYEMDDTPPFFIDDQALDIALEVALLLRLNMVGELHIARKQYLDGSIPTGFQRTTIVGVDGWIPYKDRKIRIAQLGLEEDACREVSDIGHDRVYLTDRLGMPLIEPVTYPDMRTPQETAEVAEIIRMLCRSTGKVRTGYGAGRQDVNVSVAGGTRIEIKGVPQITRIPRLIYNEAMRQCSLLRIRDELHKRGITSESFSYTASDVTRILMRADYQPIRSALDNGQRVKCVVLKGFAGILKEPTQEHTTFAREFSDRIRVIACLTSLPNMANSDSPSDTLTGTEWQKLRKKTGAGHNDALVIVWGTEKDTRCACDEIANRACEATIGVPSDTRQALAGGTNGFERVLPGAERMYPDTDLPPLEIPEERLNRIRSGLPEYVWDMQARYRELGLPVDAIDPLCISPLAGLFDRIVSELKVDPVFAAVVVVQKMKSFKRLGLRPVRLDQGTVFDVFKAFADKQIARSGVVWMLRHMLERSDEETVAVPDVQGLIDELGMNLLSGTRVQQIVAEAGQEGEGRSFPTADQKQRFLMGRITNNRHGQIEGREAAELLGANAKNES